MSLIGPKQHELFAHQFVLLYSTWFTPWDLHAYMMQNLKSLCLNLKGLEL